MPSIIQRSISSLPRIEIYNFWGLNSEEINKLNFYIANCKFDLLHGPNVTNEAGKYEWRGFTGGIKIIREILENYSQDAYYNYDSGEILGSFDEEDAEYILEINLYKQVCGNLYGYVF